MVHLGERGSRRGPSQLGRPNGRLDGRCVLLCVGVLGVVVGDRWRSRLVVQLGTVASRQRRCALTQAAFLAGLGFAAGGQLLAGMEPLVSF